MKYILVLCTALLSTMKVSSQGAFAKSGVKNAVDSIFFNILIFGTAAIIFSPGLRLLTPSILGYAVIYALCTVTFQITYTLALSSGNVSLAVMFANFGTLIPVLASCIMGERPPITRIIGIILTLCSLIIVAKPSQGSASRRAFVLSVAAMLCNGAGLTVQKLYASAGLSKDSSVFVACAYAFAALFCAIAYAALRLRGRKKSYSLGKRPIICAAAAGISLGAFLMLHTYAAGIVDGSFLYPAHAGCAILMSTLSGIIFFRDKLNKRQTVSFFLGLAAIILMN